MYASFFALSNNITKLAYIILLRTVYPYQSEMFAASLLCTDMRQTCSKQKCSQEESLHVRRCLQLAANFLQTSRLIAASLQQVRRNFWCLQKHCKKLWIFINVCGKVAGNSTTYGMFAGRLQKSLKFKNVCRNIAETNC